MALDAVNAKDQKKELKVGSKVKGNWHNQGLFYAGTVTEIKDGQYYILYDDGDKEWTTIDKLQY